MYRSLSARRAWIEIPDVSSKIWYCGTSLSARRAWIEIVVIGFVLLVNGVALRKESVDRNIIVLVGLLMYSWSLSARRAWIEIIDYIIDYATDASLSARRAWIEMRKIGLMPVVSLVALRKESVDRNIACVSCAKLTVLSLSARRAWIEIFSRRLIHHQSTVALRKESVDRNLKIFEKY